jgi:hypothetical protein
VDHARVSLSLHLSLSLSSFSSLWQ